MIRGLASIVYDEILGFYDITTGLCYYLCADLFAGNGCDGLCVNYMFMA